MKKKIFPVLLFCGTLLFGQGAVGFRFDDNQPPENWEALNAVFKKHNARFCVALNLGLALDRGEAYHKKIRQLEEDGIEIMDHTPNHNALLFRSGDRKLIAEYAKAPFVDHASPDTLYFKFIPRPVKELKKVSASLSDGCVITLRNPKETLAVPSLVKIRDQYFFVIGDRKTKKLLLHSVWAEKNVRLPDEKELTLTVYPNQGIPCPGSIEFLAEQTRKSAAKIGLKKSPVVWIQPGGAQIYFSADELGPVLKKLHYVSAATYPDFSKKGFMDPDFERNVYAMMWGSFNIENLLLAPAKQKIADCIATHRIAIGSSHITPARKGKLQEYARLHDELLAWLEENKIKVLTQSELAKLLRETKVDRKTNIFPALSKDINKDSIPDGYAVRGKIAFAKGEATFPAGKSFLRVPMLCALPHGNAVFSMEGKGDCRMEIFFEYYDTAKGMTRIGKETFSIRKNASGWTKFTKELRIPANANMMNFTLVSISSGKECFCRNPDLHGK